MRQDHHQADDNQRHNRDNLDHRKPEFHLAEHFYRRQIQAQQQQNDRQRSDPVGKAGEPELCVRGDRHHVCHAGDDPAKPVRPAGKIARPRPEQVGGKVTERFIFQI